MSIMIIDAETKLSDVDRHVKVIAGPGAGKTRWLVSHIRNVLQTSQRLKSTRKIACITYTNVGAETILKRLSNSADRVEISTIHSFLYKHVVKPYVHLIGSDYDLNVPKVEGPDEIIPSGFKFIDAWKKESGQVYFSVDEHPKIVAAWQELRWKFNATNNLELETKYPVKIGRYYIKKDSYLLFKKLMWKEGWLHHDDVLFFSWELLHRFPFLATVLRAKFPYYFVDEFQDTSPIQIKILELLSQQETTVAVIGDPAQSIYEFQGADYTQLDRFTLPNMDCYQIEGNHRSTEKIVRFLNALRSDLQQTAKRVIQGEPVYLLVGDKIKALEKAKTMLADAPLYCLCRDNVTSNKIKKGVGSQHHVRNLLEQLEIADSNSDRKRSVIAALKAVEYAQTGFFKDALKALRQFASIKAIPDKEKKKAALVLLKKLLDDFVKYKNGTTADFIQFLITNNLCNIARLSKGAAATFYSATQFKDLSVAVKSLEETGLYRTIHKAKGEEFDNVLLIIDREEAGKFNEDEELAFLHAPDFNKEEHRIKYVGISRAKQRLFISIPSLSTINATKLQVLDKQIINV